MADHSSSASNATGNRSQGGPESPPIRVICVDDHAVLIEGLRAQFAIGGRIKIVGQLASAVRLQEEVRLLRPDAVILDIEMPGPDAFDMADRIRRSSPETKVIVLSAHIRDTYVAASFAAGICAYFAKSDELEDIVDGITRVCRGRTTGFLLGPKVLRQYQRASGPLPHDGTSGNTAANDGRPDGEASGSANGDPPVTLLTRLTPREAEVLRLIGSGLSRHEIAKLICRSVKTVDGHQDRLMRKLGIPDRTGLLRFAIREGIAQP
jgi:DNA-binding NarL/FixJ family response regulator